MKSREEMIMDILWMRMGYTREDLEAMGDIELSEISGELEPDDNDSDIVDSDDVEDQGYGDLVFEEFQVND